MTKARGTTGYGQLPPLRLQSVVIMQSAAEPAAQEVRDVVEDEDDEQRQKHHVEDVGPVRIGAHRFPELQTDAAGADGADDGGASCVRFPLIERLADEDRHY